ncbi:MAG: RNA polymerase sigma factor [Candidatus Izemoplasmatales bacterium]|nr:RNA polymerase sigma factor [bacterium]MDZ4196237.1 RNA polymerase sigma factor [Candidatus Izemoplasmatales bacterium]
MPYHLDDYLHALSSRDEAAFQLIYEETKKGVYSIIIAIVKSKHITEDLMQDTYIKMLEKLDTYQRGRNFSAWLFQIAKNLAYDYVRKESRVSTFDPQEQNLLFDKVPDFEPTVIKPSLEQMLQPLDDVERQIMLLKAVNDSTFKEIAQTLSKPLGTVLWLYQRALKKMKKHLEGGNSR